MLAYGAGDVAPCSSLLVDPPSGGRDLLVKSLLLLVQFRATSKLEANAPLFIGNRLPLQFSRPLSLEEQAPEVPF